MKKFEKLNKFNSKPKFGLHNTEYQKSFSIDRMNHESRRQNFNHQKTCTNAFSTEHKKRLDLSHR